MSARTLIANGFTVPFGWLPAENELKRPRPSLRRTRRIFRAGALSRSTSSARLTPQSALNAGTNRGAMNIAFPYRIHDQPNEDKLSVFASFAAKFGYKLSLNTPETIATSFNEMLRNVQGKPEQHVLETLGIRTMSKAVYTTENIGHYGLAMEFYTHFTSPIRRYPDVLVHRVLQSVLDSKPALDKKMEEKCKHCSEQERAAMETERAANKYKQVEFMSMVEDKPFQGIISGVMDFGIFIEIIETKCEGMVRLADLKDDFYEFDEKNYRVIGRRRKKIYRLGDEVTVRIKKTDVDRRLIDLVFE